MILVSGISKWFTTLSENCLLRKNTSSSRAMIMSDEQIARMTISELVELAVQILREIELRAEQNA